MKKRGKLRKFLWFLSFIAVALAAWFAWSAFQIPAQRAARSFPDPAPRHDLGRVLVAYYSLGGNTGEVASRIRDMTNGTLLEIETQESYPAVPMLYFKAGMALKNGTLPALKTAIPDFSDYDVVFVGSPVWWYTVSLPVLSFLSQSDFQGRTVVPFCTQGGKAGDFFAHFGREARNAKVVDGPEFSGVSGTDVSALDERISSWLGGLQRSLKSAE